jgi:hypothetical protein
MPARQQRETDAILHLMSMLATHHFSVSDLWVSGSALGLTHSVTYQDHTCTVRLPSGPDDFDLGKYTNAHDRAIGGYWGPSEAMTKGAVMLVRVDVEISPWNRNNPRLDVATRSISITKCWSGSA